MLEQYKVTPKLLSEDGQEVHVCTIEKTENPIHGFWWWRWVCSCEGNGRYQGQSDYVSVFQWFRHAWRAEGIMWPKSDKPAYDWLKGETG